MGSPLQFGGVRPELDDQIHYQKRGFIDRDCRLHTGNPPEIARSGVICRHPTLHGVVF